MQTNLEAQGGLKRRLTVTLPIEKFTTKKEEVLKKKARKAKLDGFRPGKAPIAVVAKYFAHAIHEETIDELIDETLKAAFEQEKIWPVNRPSVESIDGTTNDAFAYAVEFEVAPVIDVVHFDQVTLEKVQATVTAEDVNFVIDNMTKQFGTFAAKDTACALGDRITIDFDGSIAGEKFDGGAANHYQMILGEGDMVPGFEDGIIGMKPGEEKTIDVTFPESYHAELAGKTAQFKITLHQVEEQIPAVINHALVQLLGVASGDLTELQQEIEKTLSRELNKKLRTDIHKKVFDQLVAANPIEVPASLVHEEVHYLSENAKEQFKKMIGKKVAPDFPHDLFTEEALHRVRNSYLIAKLVADHELKADAAQIRAAAEDLAASYEHPLQARDYFLTDPQHYRNLENWVLENAVVDLLLAKAAVTTVEKSYKEVMGK